MHKRWTTRMSALALFLLCLGASAQTKICPAIESNVSDPKFKPGQIWAYQNRENEPESTVTILQVDRSEKLGVIVHVRVDGLHAHNGRGELVPSVEHMPFTRDAMLLSATRLTGSASTLPTLEGYDRWRKDCGGVYTISVAEAVSVMEKTLNAP
jgi:hypothetical protein